jgi:hypothetical protein
VRYLLLILLLSIGTAEAERIPITYTEPVVNVAGGATPLSHTSVKVRRGDCTGTDFFTRQVVQRSAATGGGTITTGVDIPLQQTPTASSVTVCLCVSATDTSKNESLCQKTAVSGSNPLTFSIGAP